MYVFYGIGVGIALGLVLNITCNIFTFKILFLFYFGSKNNWKLFFASFDFLEFCELVSIMSALIFRQFVFFLMYGLQECYSLYFFKGSFLKVQQLKVSERYIFRISSKVHF
eukprot:TRINITY_DN3592_c0_g1_i1.p1 TRINITY_DN3592_c0_g1~~TRINITY_DN3592_c0_g1_i1.p1  ORF type:complete len:111 (+),score=0.84 TRINITY_DN3592_c0_g1_i1:77-409(+)